jgi:anhydro-N-acetylmuramic acid kinase
MTLYIGLMSGTSLDGVDGVLVDFDDAGSGLHVVSDAHMAMPPALGAELMALNTPGADELQRAALAANALARLQAEVVGHLLINADLEPQAVRAIGSHGQTVRHRPGEFDGTGFTLQLNNGALLAEACGIDVVCDFRSRDVAAGGQGAPLVPAFHRDVFADPVPRAILNIGGIANLTLLPSTAESAPALGGFDTGPGNALMDHWCRLHTEAFASRRPRAPAAICSTPTGSRAPSRAPAARAPPRTCRRRCWNSRPAARSTRCACPRPTPANCSCAAAAPSTAR